MTIEKRFHQRLEIEADIDVHILHRNRHIITRAQNISPYGILLSTDKLSVPTGMLLELFIAIDDYLCTEPGLVIWTSKQKIGVMFPQMQPALFTAAESFVRNNSLARPNFVQDAPATRTNPKHMLFQPEPYSSI